MGRLTRLGLLACLTLLLLAGTGLADHEVDYQQATRLAGQGEILPLEQLLELVHARYPGHLLEVELEEEDGRYVYEIELLTPQGGVVELLLDATTGEFLGVETE